MSCELSAIWPDDIYIIVAADAIIKPGDVSTTFDTMKGWKIRIKRGGSPLWYQSNSNGAAFFDYSTITGEATWSVSPVDTEEFIIEAYKPA